MEGKQGMDQWSKRGYGLSVAISYGLGAAFGLGVGLAFFSSSLADFGLCIFIFYLSSSLVPCLSFI